MSSAATATNVAAQWVSRVTGHLGAEAAITADEALQALQSIPLDAELAADLGPLFARFGYELVNELIKDRRGPGGRMVTRASNGLRQIYLVSVTSRIFEAPIEVGLAVIGVLRRAFPDRSTVYIFSPGYDDDLDDFLEEELAAWHSSEGFEARFIPWGKIQKLRREAKEDVRVDRLRLMLKLDEAAASLEEKRETIIEILTKYLDDGVSQQQDLVEELLSASGLKRAGLHPPALTGDAPQVARKIVDWTMTTKKEFPLDHDRKGQPTLGWVLKVVLDKKPEPKVARTIASIIIEHGLIADKALVGEIRKMLN